MATEDVENRPSNSRARKAGRSATPEKYLEEAQEFIRLQCFEEALDRVSMFVDFFDSQAGAGWETRRSERRFSTLRNGLILIAKLHRIFGSYLTGSTLAAQAAANAHDNHDLGALRLCILEEYAYNINALNNGVLGACCRESEGAQHGEKLQKAFMLRFSDEPGRTKLGELDEMFNSFLSAGYGARSPRFKAIVQHLRAGIAFMKAVNSGMKCERADVFEKYAEICFENEMSTQWGQQSQHVWTGIRALRSTVQLSNGTTAIQTADDSPHKLDETAKTEGNLIFAVNVAFSHAYKGEFEEALEAISELKQRFPVDENPQIAVHWRLAEAAVSFDRHFFSGDFLLAAEVLDSLRCFSPIEALFRKSLLDFVHNRFDEAGLADRLKSLRKRVDPFLKIRCRMALGTLQCASGKHAEGVEQLEKCLKSAQKLELPLLEKAAERRLAYGYMLNDELAKAEEFLERSWATLTAAAGYTLESFLAFMTKFELLKRKIAEAREDEGAVELKREALELLYAAIEFLPFASYPLLEQQLFREAALFSTNVLEDKPRANQFAKQFLAVRSQKKFDFCWFVL
ncbi:hypothetical protein M3Y99_01950800 [Aphelenchoides fujianensis]|nr:hypothetical protein M3Y99_01950800 [Aphelenchoides fujianensis]